MKKKNLKNKKKVELYVRATQTDENGNTRDIAEKQECYLYDNHYYTKSDAYEWKLFNPSTGYLYVTPGDAHPHSLDKCIEHWQNKEDYTTFIADENNSEEFLDDIISFHKLIAEAAIEDWEENRDYYLSKKVEKQKAEQRERPKIIQLKPNEP